MLLKKSLHDVTSSVSVPVSHHLWVSDASPERIPFPESLSCTGPLASFFLSSFYAQSSVNLKPKRLKFQPAAWDWAPRLSEQSLINLLFLLGFSVNASSERLNMGEIETLDDYWVPAAVPAFPLLPSDHGFSSLDTTYVHYLLCHPATNHRTNHLRLFFFFLALCVQDYFKSLLVSISDCT